MAVISGLYAITPEQADTARLLDAVRACLRGGARVVQYRSKTAEPALQWEQAKALKRLCGEFAVPLIVNDSLELARACAAEGLHLGAEDGSLAQARQALTAGILGASCYNRLELALEAQRLGADYVAFGSFSPSSTKPAAVHAELDLLRQAKRCLRIPVVAIGGITLQNAPTLIAAGADAVAVISALFDAPDIEAQARAFSQLFGERT